MKRFLSILLVCLLLVTAVPLSGFAANDALRVVISLEGFTLGQGYYVEPTAYSLDQINSLIAKDGYGPYTEDTLTAGMATLAMFNDKGLAYTLSSGTWTDSGYLGKVDNIDKGFVNFPAVITANGGPSNDNYTPNTDKNLGGGDYEGWAGWMTTVNDVVIGVSACNLILTKDAQNAYNNTYVIRWQFALASMDQGLGYVPSWNPDAAPFFTHVNKDPLMIAYAESGNATAKAQAKPVLEKLDASQSEVDSALTELKDASTPLAIFWQRIVDFFNRILDFFRSVFSR